MTPGRPVQALDILSVEGAQSAMRSDWVAVEEPLEIRLSFDGPAGRLSQSISITMRTPGADPQLAAGFLFTEGILSTQEQIEQIAHCVPRGEAQTYNVVNVSLRPGVRFDPQRLLRHVFTSSSCGVCGKATLDALKVQGSFAVPPGAPMLAANVLLALPERLRREQTAFEKTGGLHAAALFDPDGSLVALREDVGRHNALDKLIGAQFLLGATPLQNRILLVSGRTSFEILQKALVAGIPIVAAVGAPSSLAVSLAAEFGMTLVGFLRDGRFNIYAGAERIRLT